MSLLVDPESASSDSFAASLSGPNQLGAKTVATLGLFEVKGDGLTAADVSLQRHRVINRMISTQVGIPSDALR